MFLVFAKPKRFYIDSAKCLWELTMSAMSFSASLKLSIIPVSPQKNAARPLAFWVNEKHPPQT
jgi:hypothetical protein